MMARDYTIKDITNCIEKGNLLHISISSPLLYLIGKLLVVYLCWNLSYRLHDWIWLSVSPNLKRSLATRLFNRMLQQEHRFYQKRSVQTFSNTIREISHRLPRIVEICINGLWRFIVTALVSLYILFSVDYTFALLVCIWMVAFSLINRGVFSALQKQNDAVADKENELVGHIGDVLMNMQSVRFFHRKDLEAKLLHARAANSMHIEQQRDKTLMNLSFWQALSFTAMIGVSFWLLLTKFESGTITIGDFILVYSCNFHIARALWPLFEKIHVLLKNWGYTKQGLVRIYASSTNEKIGQRPLLQVSEGTITYEQVTFGHAKGQKNLFDNLSLELSGGQQVALVGYSGSGKTTFINLLLGLFKIQSGRILIDGQDIQEVAPGSLYESISVVMQQPYLFRRSIMENIRYGRLNATNEEIVEAAKKARAHEFITKLPKGYATLVESSGATKLSGGQRQRIGIARAFLKESPILILDEATSQLDSTTEMLVYKGLDELRTSSKKTTLLITHRMATLRRVNRILVFDEQGIVEDGTHEELIAKNGRYKELCTNFL